MVVGWRKDCQLWEGGLCIARLWWPRGFPVDAGQNSTARDIHLQRIPSLEKDMLDRVMGSRTSRLRLANSSCAAIRQQRSARRGGRNTTSIAATTAA